MTYSFRFIGFFGSIFLLFSCSQQKNITYFQDVVPLNDSVINHSAAFDYAIQKQDLLYINISTINAELNQLFSDQKTSASSSSISEASLYINGYVVNDSGYVELPVIGKVKVENLSPEQAKEKVKQQASLYLKNPVVDLKLLSFKISVIGEVVRPGTYKNYSNKLTIIEAISMAGDITDYGNRKNVMVFRPTESGSKIIHIDLTKTGFFNSEAYYLRPNDLVYVSPRQFKMFKINAQIYSLIFSSISTLILVINFVSKTI